MKVKPGTVDEYISSFPPDTQRVIEQMRTRIKKHLPKAEEVISYGIPCLKQDGSFVIYFAGYAKHVSLYPAPVDDAAFKEDFARYKTSKGTVQFPLDKAVPLMLIDRITKHLLTKNKQRAAEKRKK